MKKAEYGVETFGTIEIYKTIFSQGTPLIFSTHRFFNNRKVSTPYFLGQKAEEVEIFQVSLSGASQKFDVETQKYRVETLKVWCRNSFEVDF